MPDKHDKTDGGIYGGESNDEILHDVIQGLKDKEANEPDELKRQILRDFTDNFSKSLTKEIMDDNKTLLDKVEEIRIPEAPSDKTLLTFAAVLLGIGIILFFFWIWASGHFL